MPSTPTETTADVPPDVVVRQQTAARVLPELGLRTGHLVALTADLAPLVGTRSAEWWALGLCEVWAAGDVALAARWATWVTDQARHRGHGSAAVRSVVDRFAATIRDAR